MTDLLAEAERAIDDLRDALERAKSLPETKRDAETLPIVIGQLVAFAYHTLAHLRETAPETKAEAPTGMAGIGTAHVLEPWPVVLPPGSRSVYGEDVSGARLVNGQYDGDLPGGGCFSYDKRAIILPSAVSPPPASETAKCDHGERWGICCAVDPTSGSGARPNSEKCSHGSPMREECPQRDDLVPFWDEPESKPGETGPSDLTCGICGTAYIASVRLKEGAGFVWCIECGALKTYASGEGSAWRTPAAPYRLAPKPADDETDAQRYTRHAWEHALGIDSSRPAPKSHVELTSEEREALEQAVCDYTGGDYRLASSALRKLNARAGVEAGKETK